MAVAIAVATYLGLNPPGFAAQTVALAFGIAAASIFPVLMMGIFSTRINNRGAVVGMLVGLLSTVVYIFLYKGWFFLPDTNSFADTPASWFLGISPAAFGAIGALVNFAVAIMVAKMTAEPPQHIQDLVESIRTPRGAGGAKDRLERRRFADGRRVKKNIVDATQAVDGVGRVRRIKTARGVGQHEARVGVPPALRLDVREVARIAQRLGQHHVHRDP